MLGFHVNPIIALILVLTGVLLIPYGLSYLKSKIPSLRQKCGLKTPFDDKDMKIQEVLAIDNKRRLVSVLIHDKSNSFSKRVTLLIGGPNDIVVDSKEIMTVSQNEAGKDTSK